MTLIFFSFLLLISFPSVREDKSALAKLVEAIRTNYNDRYDEVRNTFIQNIVFEAFSQRLAALGSEQLYVPVNLEQ